jgi:phage-related tail protein
MATATSRTRQRPLLAIRQRMQQARTRLTTTNAATAAQNDSISRARQHLIEIRQRFQHAGTQVATLSSDIRRFFPGRSNAS